MFLLLQPVPVGAAVTIPLADSVDPATEELNITVCPALRAAKFGEANAGLKSAAGITNIAVSDTCS